MELAQSRDGLQHALVVVACSADVAPCGFTAARCASSESRGIGIRLARSFFPLEAIRRGLGTQRGRMVSLRARCDARSDELDVVDVDDVEVLRAHAAERAAHAPTDRIARVIKVGGGGSVASDFGQESVGAARELVRERS